MEDERSLEVRERMTEQRDRHLQLKRDSGERKPKAEFVLFCEMYEVMMLKMFPHFTPSQRKNYLWAKYQA
jgi:hypothetical protein